MTLQVLYGGTFDPVHNGHLAVARHARDALSARIGLMPAADPPHKGPTQADAEQRATMLALAIGTEPGLRLDRRELERAGPSYTVDTLRALRDEEGDRAPWAILIGADSFLQLTAWKAWRALFALAHIVVAARPGSDLDAQSSEALAAETRGRWTDDARALHDAPAGRLYRIAQIRQPESASEIRLRIAAGRPWRHWVAPPVADYIDRHGLYAEPAAILDSGPETA